MTETEKTLRETFRKMDAERYTQIRNAYYKAIEGLNTLADALEIADARQPQTAGPLLGEHLIAVEAIGAMNKSELGRVL